MKIKQLYHHNFIGDDLQEGDLIPVGGGIISSPEMPWKVKVDFGNFYSKFADAAERNAKQFETPQWGEWFKHIAPDVDPHLLITLQTFTTAFETKRKLLNGKKYERNALYEKAENNCVPLSEIFGSNNHMCVEIALLAKKFLDQKGIKSEFFSGEALFPYKAGDINIPSPHSFLIIHHQGQEYIFDPTIPLQMEGFPTLCSLFKPCVSLTSREEDFQKDILMIAAENIISHNVSYYGVGDCGPVPENFIVHGKLSSQQSNEPGSKKIQL